MEDEKFAKYVGRATGILLTAGSGPIGWLGGKFVEYAMRAVIMDEGDKEEEKDKEDRRKSDDCETE